MSFVDTRLEVVAKLINLSEQKLQAITIHRASLRIEGYPHIRTVVRNRYEMRSETPEVCFRDTEHSPGNRIATNGTNGFGRISEVPSNLLGRCRCRGLGLLVAFGHKRMRANHLADLTKTFTCPEHAHHERR